MSADGSSVGTGTPILKKVDARGETISGTAFTRGDYAITVQWFHRFLGGPLQLTYVKDAYKSHASYDVVNSTELRLTGFQMEQVQMPVTVPLRRRSGRVAAQDPQQHAVPNEPDTHYALCRKLEAEILEGCW